MPRWFIKIVGHLFKMIYIADGPSDVPGFSIVRKIGGKAYRVYKPSNDAEFAQNELLLQTNRIHAYAPAHNGSESNTSIWPRLYTRKIRDRIVGDRELNFAKRISGTPKHLEDEAQASKNGLEQELQGETNQPPDLIALSFDSRTLSDSLSPIESINT